MPQHHLLVGVQDAADRAVANGVAADSPVAADGVLYYLLEVVGLPERVTAERGVAGVWLAQAAALGAAVHAQLQAPDPEPAAVACGITQNIGLVRVVSSPRRVAVRGWHWPRAGEIPQASVV